MNRTTKRQIGWTVSLLTSTPVECAFLARLLLVIAIPILLGSLVQACGGGGGAPVTNIKSITIDPVNSSIAVGTKVQLHATANFKNKTTKDVTDSVTWESTDEAVVTVSNAAAIKGLAGGKAAYDDQHGCPEIDRAGGLTFCDLNGGPYLYL